MISRFASTLLVVGLILILGHVTAGRGVAQPPPAQPTHQDLGDQINSLQTTVNGINTWSQTLPAANRFESVMGGTAVLDKETALVWEKAPDLGRKTWIVASVFCNQRAVGNRKGWRLPTVQELASLLDPGVPSPGPTLPAGHPFSNVQPFAYWSATAHDGEPTAAWFVTFSGDSPDVFVLVKTFDQPFAWCVRGGHGGTDTQ
jgi:hypothetical protein